MCLIFVFFFGRLASPHDPPFFLFVFALLCFRLTFVSQCQRRRPESVHMGALPSTRGQHNEFFFDGSTIGRRHPIGSLQQFTVASELRRRLSSKLRVQILTRPRLFCFFFGWACVIFCSLSLPLNSLAICVRPTVQFPIRFHNNKRRGFSLPNLFFFFSSSLQYVCSCTRILLWHLIDVFLFIFPPFFLLHDTASIDRTN